MDTRGFNFLSWSCFIFHFSSMYYCIQSFSHIINLERSCYFSTMTAQDSVPKRCDVGSFGGGGGESRTFLGRDAPVRNDVPDGWRKQILKGSMEKQGLWLGSNKMWTAMNTQQTIQIFFITVKVLLESRWSSSRLRWRGGGRCVGRGAHHLFHSPRSNPAVFYLDTRGFLTFFHGVTGDGRPSTYPEAWRTLDFRARLCRERSGLIQDHTKSLCCAIGKDTLLSQCFPHPALR